MPLALVAGMAGAQPGEGPTIAEVEARHKQKLEELAFRIRSAPSSALFVERAELYVAMYRGLVLHRPAGRHFVERAIDDFSAAIDLQPSALAYLGRVWCSREMHWTDPPKDHPAKMIDFFLKAPAYAGYLSDFQNALRLSTSDGERSQSLDGLASLHAWRARHLATSQISAELRARGDPYSIWEDFGRSLEYATQRARLEPRASNGSLASGEQGIGEIYVQMGRAAARLGEFDRALTAFQSAETYLTDHNAGICSYYAAWGKVYASQGLFLQSVETYTRGLKLSEWNCRPLLEYRGDAYLAHGQANDALADYDALFQGNEQVPGCTGVAFCAARLPIKRAQAYLRLQQPQKAVAEITFAIEKAFIGHCPQVLLLRAKAYRQLGDVASALVDEQRAARLNPSQACLDYYVEGWDVWKD